MVMRHDRRPSRRDFCAVAGAGLVLVSLPACEPGTGERIGEGSLGSTGDGTGGNGTGANGTGGNGTGNGGSGGVGSGGSGGAGGDGGSGGNGGGGTGGGGSGGGGGGGGAGGSGDMGAAPDDLATQPACTPGTIKAGTASSYTVGGTPKLIQSGNTELFVVRDASGLYAVSAICPHAGCTCEVQGNQYYCPCHGATFAFDGSKPTSPAHSSLPHYAMCVDAAGNVTINPKMSVPSTTRY